MKQSENAPGKRILYCFFSLLILIDIVYSFIQHYHFPLDGDMASLIVPDPWHVQMLRDPFGFNVLIHHARYAGPNRFLCHWSLSNYFKTVPLLLQHFLNPIDSVYAACAVAKTLIQIFILWLLAFYASGTGRIRKEGFIIMALIITPLFQTTGYYDSMGIIDHSITYTFFYAFPLAFLLLLFLPFYRKDYLQQNIELNLFKKIFLVSLGVILLFSGPLIAPIVLISCPMLLFILWLSEFRKLTQRNFFARSFKAIGSIPRFHLIYFIFMILVSLYSFYIGTFNSENSINNPSLAIRYGLLPKGLFEIFTVKPGLGLLLIMIATNTIVILRQQSGTERKRILNMLMYLIIFSAIYILLLPLGGYRVYRPYIIRYDTFMPVTLCMMYFFAASTYYLIHRLPFNWKKIYGVFIAVFLLVLTNADRPISDGNACERAALEKMANSPEKIVAVDCPVLQWNNSTNPDDSRFNAQLIHYWNITNEEKLYFQK